MSWRKPRMSNQTYQIQKVNRQLWPTAPNWVQPTIYSATTAAYILRMEPRFKVVGKIPTMLNTVKAYVVTLSWPCLWYMDLSTTTRVSTVWTSFIPGRLCHLYNALLSRKWLECVVLEKRLISECFLSEIHGARSIDTTFTTKLKEQVKM